jgi:hypothetical protein
MSASPAIHDGLVRSGITFLPGDGNGEGVRAKRRTLRPEMRN